MSDDSFQLFCVVGGSPAVVTETVYALAVVDTEDDPAEHIERIRVMTTTHGRDKLQPVLLEQLRRMARDYPEAAGRIPTSEDRVLPIEVASRPDTGEELDDVRDSVDSAAMADAIFTCVRQMTSDGQLRLHASMAGGRKTMGYFVGNAMWFFGRRGDRLSHVLAGRNAEQCKHFFYPPPRSTTLKTYSDVEFDAALESVELHEIPFVRLPVKHKDYLPDTFAETIRSVQEELVGPARLVIDLEFGSVRFGGEKLRLTPLQTALYIVLAVAHDRGQTPIGRRDFLDGREGRLSELQEVYEDILGGVRDEAFFWDARANFRGEQLTKKLSNVTTQMGKIREEVRRRLREFEYSLITPESPQRRGYTLGIDPGQIDIKGEHLYPG
ncbi:MAG: CRISPR-associated ring nuclease Csm6 [Persicimonas sp.]